MNNDDIQQALDHVLAAFPGSKVVMTKRDCRLCGAKIIFIRGPNGKTMVFDDKPTTAWFLDERTNEARPFQSHVPHWATCPHADAFRKGKR